MTFSSRRLLSSMSVQLPIINLLSHSMFSHTYHNSPILYFSSSFATITGSSAPIQIENLTESHPHRSVFRGQVPTHLHRHLLYYHSLTHRFYNWDTSTHLQLCPLHIKLLNRHKFISPQYYFPYPPVEGRWSALQITCWPGSYHIYKKHYWW